MDEYLDQSAASYSLSPLMCEKLDQVGLAGREDLARSAFRRQGTGKSLTAEGRHLLMAFSMMIRDRRTR